MATNGVPEVPSLDVAAALGPSPQSSGADVTTPYTPLVGLQGAAGVTPGALPLLVRMPDGERRQIELPPTATVRDLREALPNDSNWDFNFNGQQLSDASTLAAYNIPDAYGHAGGLLRMITDSGNLDTTQKAELVKNACNVVQHISRGETDMERLISAAFDDSAGRAGGAGNPPGSPTQPSLTTIRRGKRSFLSLNFSNLPPPGPAVERLGSGPIAPPTPSQLIQKLSASRPDLYPPTTASRMLVDLDNPVTPGAGKIEPSVMNDASNNPMYGMPMSSPQPPVGGSTNGEFKRVNTNTWFNEFAKTIAPLDADNNIVRPPGNPIAAHDAGIGDSEDEDPSGHQQRENNGTSAPATDSDPTHPDKSRPAEGATSKASDSYLRSDGDNDSSAPAESGDQPVFKVENKGASSQTSGARESADESQVAEAPQNAAPAPKKRGRKRKNPELSEEERKLLRQAQNRASAKQSRQRRKEMAKEFQQRVNTLEGENEHLRDTVAALADRLQFLQNLLTVSVQKRPPGPPGM